MNNYARKKYNIVTLNNYLKKFDFSSKKYHQKSIFLPFVNFNQSIIFNIIFNIFTNIEIH